MFYKLLPNGKYRYYEKYFDEREDKWKQVSVTLKSKKRQVQAEAKRLLAEKILLNQSVNQEGISSLIASDIIEDWLAIRRSELKISTYMRQLTIVNAFCKQFGDQKITKIKGMAIQRYLLANDWSVDYRFLHKTVLSLFFAYCVKVGYLKENPIDYIVLPRKKQSLEVVARKKERFLSKTEMSCYLSFLKDKGHHLLFNLLIEFLYLTGLRSGEAFGLDWTSVDLSKRSLDVCQNLFVYDSLDNYELTTPKTINSYRTVLFNERVVSILKKVEKLTGKTNGFVFCNEKGKPLSLTYFNKYLRRTFAESGILKSDGFHLTSHVLRHSHISLLVEMNVPIKMIMERVGHSDEKTTIQIYTHVTERMNQDLSEKLESIVFD